MQSQPMEVLIRKAILTEDYKLANGLVKEYIQTNGNEPFVWTALAKLQTLKKQWIPARQSLAKALQIKNSYSWAHAVNGFLEAQQGNDKEARDSFEFAIQLEPDNLDSLFEYATYLEHKKYDLQKAERLVRRRMIVVPDQALNFELHGRILLAQKELDEAENAFKTAIRLDKKYEKAYIGLARIELFHRKNAFAAVDWLRPALLLNPDSWQLRHYFSYAQNDKNSLYGFLWKSGLFYGASVKWNWYLLAVSIALSSLYFYLVETFPIYMSVYNIVYILFIIYCVYCWSSRLLMQILLERQWLN